MAPISKLIYFLFLLSLSIQVNARDSQFFSKITPIKDNNNVREVPNNEEQINKPEEQPVFTPETENSYGLYGHESGLNPPSTTYKPYKTTTEEEFNNNNNNFQKDGYNTKYQNEFSNTRLAANSYNNNNFNNKQQNEFSDTRLAANSYNNNNNFNNKQQNELSDTKFTEGGYNSMENQNQNENNKYYYNNNAANEKYYYNNNNNGPNDRYSYKNKVASNGHKGERLGMSDTRFMEGGKYFYNVNSEKYNPTTVNEGQGSSNSENWYDNKGYFGNNNNVNKNSMEGYQNQEEFEEDQQEFEP